MNTPLQEKIYDQWLSEHRAILFKVVRAYAFGPEDQEDLFQEIALQLWKSVPGFQAHSAVTTWIYRVALNTALKWSGKQRHQKGSSTDPEVLLPTSAYENEQVAWLYEQIARLSKVDRSLIILMLDGFSYREIAGIAGISESNVGVKIHRIKKQLAQASKTGTHYEI
jgi:RNA polymerase sigma-70 factor (ECF subfamily)